MNEATCDSCHWWRSLGGNARGDQFGRCHRNPPILIRSLGETANGLPRAFFSWPTTTSEQFCGEHSNWSGE